MSSLTLAGLPQGLPVITSPENGATVKETFDVHWTFDDAGMSFAPGYQYLVNPDLLVVAVSPILGEEIALRFETSLLAPGPQQLLDLEIIEGKGLPSPVFTSSSRDLVGDDFNFRATFQAISNPVTLYVVPEPNLSWFACTGATVLLCRRALGYLSINRHPPRQ